jgi:hypothetical protein
MGIGLVLGMPRRSIQHERIYLTPAFSSFALASLTRFLSGSASDINVGYMFAIIDSF